MNKIICEVCGTAYQETTTQCPICGCVRTTETDDMPTDITSGASARTYTYVKGGRFSKANVKKRNRAKQANENSAVAASAAPQRTKQAKKKNNTGLIITAIILLIAIIAIVIYLLIKLFWPGVPAVDETMAPPVAEQTETADNLIPCEALTLDIDEIQFESVGSARMLYASAEPIDTTDTVSFASTDTTVATVTQNGKVEAVGPGRAEIIVSCGDMSVSCTVICEFIEPTEVTTGAVLEEVIVSAEEIWLNRKDITLAYNGEEWILYSGKLSADAIEWVSDKDSVAAIENGTVKAVGSGMTTVYAAYKEEAITGTQSIVVNLYNGADKEQWSVTCTDAEGNEVTAPIADGKAIFNNLDPSKTYDITVKVSCIIRCSFTGSDYQGVGGHGGVGEDA